MKNPTFYLSLLAMMTIFVSCEKDDPEVPNEEELITSLTLTLTDANGQESLFSFSDLDGDGGNDPIVNVSTLMANTSYTAAVSVMNELETPAEDITIEVREEGDEHQFFYMVEGANATFTYDDMDVDGLPVGIDTMVMTGDASAGTMTITLKHEPNKTAAGVEDGNIMNAGGETDIEVSFDLVIQ